MIEHILRESIPGLRAFLEQPTPETFRRGMAGLLEALEEDERHSGQHGAWAEMRLLTPPITKVLLRQWSASGPLPTDAMRATQAVLAFFHKQGISHTRSGTRSTTQSMPAVAVPAAGVPVAPTDPFGRPVTAQALAPAAPSMAQGPYSPPLPAAYAPSVPPPSTLQQRMEAVPYQDLMDAALRWQVDAGQPPLAFLQFLAACRDRLPPDGLEPILTPLGIGAAYFHAWCQSASGLPVPGTQWPEPPFQYRVMRQFLGFFTLVELNRPAQSAQQFAYRLYAVGTLLPREDIEQVCLQTHHRAPIPGMWSYVTPELLGAWSAGQVQVPPDAALVENLSNIMAEMVYLRFRGAAF